MKRSAAALLLGWFAPAHAATADAAPGGIVQMLSGLIVVLVLIAAAAWAMRRFGRLSLGGRSDFRVLAGMSVGARERVVLVQVGDAQLVLGVAPGRVQTLHVLSTPLAMAQPGDGPDAFAQRLATLLKAGRKP